MRRTILALMVCMAVLCATAGCSEGTEKGLVGSWQLDSATVNGTKYSAAELMDMAGELGEFGQLLNIQYVFKKDGTGEMLIDNVDLGDVDMTLKWEGEGSAYTITTSNGNSMDIAYDEEADSMTLSNEQTSMVYRRAE